MFGAKRSDKPLVPPTYGSQPHRPPLLNTKKPSRIFGGISRKTMINTRLTVGDHSQSSSSSSSGTNSLGTAEGLVRSSSKVAWVPWLGRKKSNIAKKLNIHREEWDLPRQERQSRPPPTLRIPPGYQLTDETEDESSESEEDDSEDASALSTTVLNVSPLTLAKCHNNLQAMIANSLQPPFSPPPLLHVSGQPIFPRSCNPRRSLYVQETMESRMHKARILRRIDHQQITQGQNLSIISFGMRPPPTKRPSLQLDDETVSPTFLVRTYSQGLQRWAMRPCFEDRMAVWTLEERTGKVMHTRVTGTSFGVATLEISEAVDVLAGAISEESDLEPPSTKPNLFTAPQGRNAPRLPSPLRMEHSPPPSISSSGTPKSNSRTMPAVPIVKRGVRFAEDDKEDQIPLSYVLRIKKRREDKARFLQEERERRAFEEDRARQDEERLRREAERREWEKEKQAWEKEKKAIDERRQRQYAEEVVAARIRREASRSGLYALPSAQETQVRETRPERLTPDVPRAPRRQASEPIVTTWGSGSPHTSSPASSNPPSANGGSPSASGFFSSRPQSINSANTTLSSAEDLQQQRKNPSKRSSLGLDHPLRQAGDRTSQSYFPMWSNNYLVPPVSPMPGYHMNMPLLPPTPPFMMEQNGHSHSPNSRSTSRSSSPHQKLAASPSNSSTERHSPTQRSTTSSTRPELQRHRRGSSNDALVDVQRPSLSDRRSGSAADINRRSNPQRSQQPHPPVASRSQNMWGTPTSRGRLPLNHRQSVIT